MTTLEAIVRDLSKEYPVETESDFYNLVGEVAAEIATLEDPRPEDMNITIREIVDTCRTVLKS